MRKILTLAFITLLLASCGKGGGNNDKPSVTTLPVTNITTTSATSGVNITSRGGSALTDAGIMWDTTSKFTTAHDSSNYTSATTFSITIPGLSPGTTWYVRAYAKNSAGTTYGNTVQFTTDTIPSDYTVTTIAGNGTAGIGNGAALSASFAAPWGVAAAPGGIVYVGDGTALNGQITSSTNGYVRRIGTDGTVSTLAMVGRSSTDVVVDPSSGNVYDLDLDGNLYRITPSGVVDTVATGLSKTNICMDIDNNGNLYATILGLNSTTSVIAKITPAGVVKILPAKPLKDFEAIGIDRSNNTIYVSDGNYIEKVDTLGNITFIAGGNGTADGTGSGAGFGVGESGASEIRVDKNGNLIVANGAAFKVRMVTPAGVVTTIAGNGSPGDQDGSAAKANFSGLIGLTVDSQGNIFVSDNATHKIKRITHK